MFATQITRRVRSYFEDRSVSIRDRAGRTKRLSRPARFEQLEDRTLLSITAGLGAGNTLEQPQYVPGEILIGFEGDVVATFATHGATAALQAAGRQFGGLSLNARDVLFELPKTVNHAARLATRWQLPENADVLATAEQLASLPGIAYAEPNYVVSTMDLPNDPKFDELWGLDNLGQTGGVADADIDAPEAWDISTGSGDVVVGVIDTGVNYNHVDLAANIWTNPDETPDNGIDDDKNGFIDDVHGWDFANDDNDPMDDNKHGTHVAGTIGAVGDNEVGVAGVNWNVQIMPLKFLNNRGLGTTADAIDAVNYATMMRRDFGVNIVVTNNSWGGGAYSQALSDAILASGEANMLFVASAGNTGGGASFPAKYGLDNIISVGATDHSDALASFSSRGSGVDLAAPGVDILSTMRKSYSTLSGTSMAAPHVTGVVALAWDRLSGTAPDDYRVVRDTLFAGVDPLPSLTGLTGSGGRLNAYTTLVIADALDGKATTISIEDVSQLEGDLDTSDFVFTVSRTGDISAEMTVDWATSDGTATVADNQYNHSSGTLTFGPGVTSQTIPVQVHGDTLEEAHGTFFVNLTNLQGETKPALIVDAQATGTILNDETTVSISDATATEGDTSMAFIEVFAAKPGGGGGLDDPGGMAFGLALDADGIPDHLYVSSYRGNEVLRYDTKTGQGETYLSEGLFNPADVLFGPDNNLYVSNAGTSEILRYDGTTGAPLPSEGNPGARYASFDSFGARGLVFDADDNLYVATATEVLRFQGPSAASPGALIDVFVSSESSSLSSGKELQFGPDGNLYVVSAGTDEVLRYDGTTGDFIGAFVAAGSGGLDDPRGLLFANGVLYVASRGDSDAVLLYDEWTGEYVSPYIPSGSGGLDNPYALVFGVDGTLYVTANATDEILRYGPASQAAFTVSLSTPVGHSVTVDVTTSGGTATPNADYISIATSPRIVTFSPNDTSHSLLIATLDDSEVEGSETFSVNLSNPNGANSGDLTGLGTILDNEPPPPQPGITVSPTSGLVTTEAGGADSFTVVLDTQPTADVTIDISSSKTDEGTVSPISLTFTTTNWSTPQLVTVTGVDDVVLDGDVAYTIVTASATDATEYVGIDPADVLVTNVDNETPVGLAVESIAPNTMDAGKSIAVIISGSGFAAGASVTFTNGKGVAPTASNISIDIGGTSITATVSAHKQAKAIVWDVVVTNADGSTGACSGCFGVGVVPSAHATNQQLAMAASLDVQADETHTVPHAASISLLALAFESSTVETFLGDGGSGGTSRLFVEEAAEIDYTTRTANRWHHARAVDNVMTLRGRESGSAEETSFELDGIGGDLRQDLIENDV